MAAINTSDPAAVAAVAAIRAGRVDDLRKLLAEHPHLACARLGDDDSDGMSRTLLHVATDWPGHFPEVAATISALVDAGADVNGRFRGRHRETPLHWAASSNDLDALSALLDAGADIDADGGVIACSTPLADATAFAQWDAARLLIKRGAHARLFDLAALGHTGEILEHLDRTPSPLADDLNRCFWSACHGGQLVTARALADRGADLDWLPPWEDATPLDIAAREGAHAVVRWLHSRGAHTSDEIKELG